MNDLQSATIAVPCASEHQAATAKPKSAVGTLQCLVVTPGQQRAKWFEHAAAQQGWKTIVAHNAEDAARQAVRNRIQLAVVDLQSVVAGDEQSFRDLVEQLSTGDGPLLVVCGSENDVMGEIWSRQLGVWMYLPGVDDQSDIALVCGEAKNVVERLRGANQPVC